MWPLSLLKYNHEFLVFGVPEEKYGHHTALVWHKPKDSYRKAVAVFGRMEKEIAKAELLGEIRMSRPYAWDELEEDATSLDRNWVKGAGGGTRVFEQLEKHTKNLKGESIIPVAVYLVKVKTNRRHLLFDGQKATLPSGYLTFYTGSRVV
ncbi:hypothetical protein B0H19DRAFT_1082242 [Mycena capillaripes]|nr:hypothetical protein B0H19DRAFT_1082242 [Mycena capillaripes]